MNSLYTLSCWNTPVTIYPGAIVLELYTCGIQRVYAPIDVVTSPAAHFTIINVP